MAVKGTDGTKNLTQRQKEHQQQQQQDCRQYYTLGAEADSFEEEFECDEPVDVPLERLRLSLKEEDEQCDAVQIEVIRDGALEEEVDLGREGVSGGGVSLAEELFEAAARQVGERQGGKIQIYCTAISVTLSPCENHATFENEFTIHTLIQALCNSEENPNSLRIRKRETPAR